MAQQERPRRYHGQLGQLVGTPVPSGLPWLWVQRQENVSSHCIQECGQDPVLQVRSLTLLWTTQVSRTQKGRESESEGQFLEQKTQVRLLQTHLGSFRRF